MEERPDSRRGDWGRIALVALLAIGVRGWVITHTEVVARDSIGFIRYALQLEDEPLLQVIRRSEQHPGYPLSVMLVSKPVRALTGGLSCDAMTLSAQLASAIAAILMIVPVFFLGKALFGRQAGFLAAALLQCLPVFVHVTTDGLSEALFLLFLSSGLYFAVAGMQIPSARRFLLCGLFTGLAYLTRPEGGELALAAGLILVAVGSRSWGWRRTAIRAAALAAGFLPFLAFYVGITGHLTNKPTGQEWLGKQQEAAPIVAKNCPTLLAAFWDPQLEEGKSRLLWGGKTLFWETAKAFHYVGAVLAVLGLIWFRRRLRDDAGMWVSLALAGIHAVVLWRMAIVTGYISERHTLVFVLIGSLWAAAVIPELGRWLGSYIVLARPDVARWGTALICAGLLISALPELSKPLHANRAGHHAAGCWMATHVSAADEIIDPFCWGHYYAGCVFREGKTAPPPIHTRFVVLEQGANQHMRLTGMSIARDVAAHGEIVYHWPEQRPLENAQVVVYRVDAGN